MPPIVAAGIFLAFKTVVNYKTNKAIRGGVYEARNKVISFIKSKVLSQFISIICNVVAFLIAVFLIGPQFSKENAIFIISVVYLSSVLYTVYNIVSNVPEIYKFIFIYRFNLKDFISDKIYFEVMAEVRREKANLNWYESIFDKFFGKKDSVIAREITNNALYLTWSYLISMGIKFLIAIIVYLVIFNVITRPYLLTEYTGLGNLQVLIYPFLFSIDYTLGSNLASIIL